MIERKKETYEWEYGEETVSLHIGMYADNARLYIGMNADSDDEYGGEEPFGDMTVNIPWYSLEPGEAFISGYGTNDLLRFIKKHKLGKVLPYRVKSGYETYAAVSFDLEKLKEFDPEGVEKFKEEWKL